MATTRKAPTLPERIKMYEILKDVIIPTNEDGFVLYDEGWDDARVAKAVNPELANTCAATVRKEMFGKLREKTGSVTSAHHADHEKRITVLENQLRRLIDAINLNPTQVARVIGNSESNKGKKFSIDALLDMEETK